MNALTLKEELKNLEGVIGQDPETGKHTMLSYVRNYTNKLFGAPFQLLDSVDKRFDEVNKHVGSEYLRNILLNSPIVRIRPGMPKYTGADSTDDLLDMIRKLYFASNTNRLSGVQSLLRMLSKSTIFKAGSRLQRRMFGFRETYYDYMQHVNYMCRSCAVFLYLTDGTKFPDGTFPSNSSTMKPFSDFKWENYRMMDGSTADSPLNYLTSMLGSSLEPIFGSFGVDHSSIYTIEGVANYLNEKVGFDGSDTLSWHSAADKIDFANEMRGGGVAADIGNKITSVEFMVDPGSYNETMTNDTGQSKIEETLDGLGNEFGAEIAFITNSHADTGVVGDVMNFLGSSMENAVTSVSNLVEGVTGGFMGNLISGALGSIKGQKMIYPEIYKKSTTTMNYSMSITLTSPYGDAYNYYMNILVPLLHLIALSVPRMVTANTVASPFLVQMYIPGQCTCQLGIISQMDVVKNPNSNKVSVNGFPLEVKVTFTVKELYNALSISPANDPASFLFNETLNDYLANLSGLIPSIDSYTLQNETAFYALEDYLAGGGIVNDAASVIGERFENWANPFYNR